MFHNPFTTPDADQQVYRASTDLIGVIARAYRTGALTTAEAADLHRQYAPGDAGLPECEHGVHCAALLDGVPMCALCQVEAATPAPPAPERSYQ